MHFLAIAETNITLLLSSFLFAMAEPSYIVHVYICHSPEHATNFLSSSYSSFPEFHVPGVSDGECILRGKYPGSTSFLTIKNLLQDQCNIPLSIQSHFRDFSTTVDNRYAEGKDYWDEATLKEAWEDEQSEVWEDCWSEEDRNPGTIRLALVTTGKRLKEMDHGSLKQGNLADRVKAWRYSGAALQHLRSKRETCFDPQQQRAIDDKIEEYSKLEMKKADDINRLLWDWERWVDGVEGDMPRVEEQDIEARFTRWMQRKQEITDKLNKKIEAPELPEQPKEKEQGRQEQQEQQPPTVQRPDWPVYISPESRVEFHFPPIPEGKEMPTTHTVRDEDDKLIPTSDGFVLHSGILLWGHLHTVFAGSIDPEFQGNAESFPDMLETGGTIMQHPLRYRSAARNGKWKVRKIYGDRYYAGEIGEPKHHFGWIVYHEDVDPLEALVRGSRITPASGISLKNDHVDKDVLYVNRYNWGYHCDPGRVNAEFRHQYRDFIQRSTGASIVNWDDLDHPGDIEGIQLLKFRWSGYLMVLDAEQFSDDIMPNFIRDCPSSESENVERVFRNKNIEGEDENFGLYVSKTGTEYDFGEYLLTLVDYNSTDTGKCADPMTLRFP